MTVRPRFGVEIEFTGANIPEMEIADALTKAGLPTRFESYNHRTRDYWKLTTDSSCGLELVTPPLYWEQRHSIREACRVLRSCGAEVNGDCGLHVHHEWVWRHGVKWRYRSDMNERLLRVVRMYEQCEPLLRCLIPLTRFSNDPEHGASADRFCRWNYGRLYSRSYDDEGMVSVVIADRAKYYAVNTTNLDDRTTIEYRQHQGTLNARKILAWVELTRQITHAASLHEDQVEETRDRIELVFGKLSASTWTYFGDRCAEAGKTLDVVLNEVNEHQPQEAPQ